MKQGVRLSNSGYGARAGGNQGRNAMMPGDPGPHDASVLCVVGVARAAM
ncbi:hypothetical protein [Roseovarius pacificus]|nr:hypothetical protein [Roseovarius pacificus]